MFAAFPLYPEETRIIKKAHMRVHDPDPMTPPPTRTLSEVRMHDAHLI